MNNKKRWIGITVIVILLTNFITFFVTNLASQRPLAIANGGLDGKLPASNTYNNSDILKKYNKLFTVRDNLYKYYDGNIDDDALLEGAIKGMTSALNDPYTVFMNKKEWEDFNSQTEGSYEGLGLQVGVKEDKIVVIAPFEDSPAKSAGILTGDIIERVNGKDVTGKELENAVNMMKGKAGSEVSLTLSRENKGTFDVKLTRAKITLVTVKGEMLSSNIGYIQITMFDENTAQNFNKKLKELQGKGMKGLVLDLRGNPGGLLDQCVQVISNFVEKNKVIVSTIDKYKKKNEYESKGGSAIGLPLVVLTDGGTASASEIISGAVRDYKIGTLVGEKTFGKGVVQTMLYNKLDGFGDGTALKVTISRYYTPNGENIHGKGIMPDVEIKYPEELKAKPYSRTADPQFSKALEILKGKIK